MEVGKRSHQTYWLETGRVIIDILILNLVGNENANYTGIPRAEVSVAGHVLGLTVVFHDIIGLDLNAVFCLDEVLGGRRISKFLLSLLMKAGFNRVDPRVHKLQNENFNLRFDRKCFADGLWFLLQGG